MVCLRLCMSACSCVGCDFRGFFLSFFVIFAIYFLIFCPLRLISFSPLFTCIICLKLCMSACSCVYCYFRGFFSFSFFLIFVIYFLILCPVRLISFSPLFTCMICLRLCMSACSSPTLCLLFSLCFLII